MGDFWHFAADWVGAHRAQVAALVIAGLALVPILAVRLIRRHHQRQRVKALHADLGVRNTVWALRRLEGLPVTGGKGDVERFGAASKRLYGNNGVLSVAILPFERRAEADAATANAFAQDVFSLLTRNPDLDVRTVHFERGADAIAGMPTPLTAHYLLEGSLEIFPAGPRKGVRVIVQVIETATGDSIFADSFEGPLRSLAGMQDDIAESLFGALGLVVAQRPAPEAADAPTDSLSAWALKHRAVAVLRQGMSRQRLDEAVRLLDHASRIDPRYAHAKLELVEALSLRVLFLTSADKADDLTRARAALAGARALTEAEAGDLALADGLVKLAAGEANAAVAAFGDAGSSRHEAKVAAIYQTWAALYAGRDDVSLAAAEQALGDGETGPARAAIARFIIALSMARAGNYADARRVLATSMDELRAFHMTWLLKGLSASLAGDQDRARDLFARARRVMGAADPAVLQAWVETAAGSRERATAWGAAFEDAWKR